jgi:Fungal chitosanase of glycosyl hydrolase group 75
MRSIIIAIAVFFISAGAKPVSASSECGRESAARSFGGIQVWRAGDAVGFTTTELRVDADGAPNSYRVDGKGLSFTCDGVSAIENGRPVTPKSDPRHWQQKCQEAWGHAQQTGDYSEVRIFGFLKDKEGHPVIQKAGDPLPNEAYVTTTTLTIPGTVIGTQRYWVDAVRIPYIVLSDSFAKFAGLSPGDVAVLYRPRTDATAFAVYGDCCGLGEGSVKLHQDLKSDPIVVSGGVSRAKRGIDDRVVTVVFPGHHTHPSPDSTAWYKEIQSVGNAALSKWGGPDRLKACAE